MKKSFTISLYIFLFMLITIMLFCSYITKSGQKESRDFSEYLKNTGARFLNSEIYCSVKLDKSYLNEESIENIVQQYLRNLGADIAKANKIQNGVTDGLNTKYEVLINENVEVEINTITDNEHDSGYLNIKIVQYLNDEKQNRYKKCLRDISKNNGLKYKISTTIMGYFTGKLKDTQIDSVYRKLLKEANATTVETVKDNGLVSITAYSPELKDYIKIGNKKVNLNFAARYNSYEKRTYVWIANPVIITEY